RRKNSQMTSASTITARRPTIQPAPPPPLDGGFVLWTCTSSAIGFLRQGVEGRHQSRRRCLNCATASSGASITAHDARRKLVIADPGGTGCPGAERRTWSMRRPGRALSELAQWSSPAGGLWTILRVAGYPV